MGCCKTTKKECTCGCKDGKKCTCKKEKKTSKKIKNSSW